MNDKPDNSEHDSVTARDRDIQACLDGDLPLPGMDADVALYQAVFAELAAPPPPAMLPGAAFTDQVMQQVQVAALARARPSSGYGISLVASLVSAVVGLLLVWVLLSSLGSYYEAAIDVRPFMVLLDTAAGLVPAMSALLIGALMIGLDKLLRQHWVGHPAAAQ